MYAQELLVNSVIHLLTLKEIKTDKVHLQKYIAFLADNEPNIPFSFSIYRYGPFSRDLESTLDIMCGWEDIIYEDDEYIIKDSKPNLLGKTELNKISSLLDKFHNVLPDSHFRTLELYSTLYYYMKRANNKDLAIKKFKDAKEDKFTDILIEKAYVELLEVAN